MGRVEGLLYELEFFSFFLDDTFVCMRYGKRGCLWGKGGGRPLGGGPNDNKIIDVVEEDQCWFL